MFSAVMTSQRARPQPISRGSSAAWITDGMPTRTSGMPNLASWAAMRKSQAAATSNPPPRHQPGSRAITGAGKLRTASQRSRSRVMKASADFWSSFAISLMSAPPIMLFSLWPARITARMPLSPASFSNPSRTPSVTAEERMLSEPALQIERRTTPRLSRSIPQCGIEHFHFVFPDLFWTVDATSRDIAPACQGEKAGEGCCAAARAILQCTRPSHSR